MKNAWPESSSIPNQVADVLRSSKIGYLSVLSKSQELYSYPVAFHYSGLKVYFMTPVSAAKFKILKANPKVSFIVDNGKVTTEACGAMIQGRAKILTIGRTLMSILSVGPKIVGFTKKYPGMLTFYARGKELPDERKLYKYRLIRVDPSKIIYWSGYTFGRYLARPTPKADKFELTRDESGLDVTAKLLLFADSDSPDVTAPASHDWLTELNQTAREGIVSEEERAILAGYKTRHPAADSEPRQAAGVTNAERSLLKKSRQR